MATATTQVSPAVSNSQVIAEKLSRGPSRIGTLVFGLVLIAGLIFIGTSISRDLGDVTLGSAWPYVLLGLALLVALGFEFVNGFHDTANAVATVIYTHSLDPNSRGGLVGLLELFWSGDFDGSGSVWHRFVAARGIDLAGGKQRRVCDGVRSVDRSNRLEPGDLVVRIARFELAHADRIDHRGGHRPSTDER